MKAILYNRKATPERLVYCDVDKPVPSADEVLVKIHSVSLNAADYRSMKMSIIPEKKIFGADIAGIVEEAGKDSVLFKPGDKVIGDLGSYGFGGLAEYVAAPEKALIKMTEQLTFDEASALPMASLTALQALRDKGMIREGMKVLIVGSSGGVGVFAVQLAKYFGTEVTGVCSSGNVHQTRTLGADYVIDYTKERFLKSGKKYDIILGINGNYPLFAYRSSLPENGIFVMIGGSLSQIFKSILFGRLLSFGSRKMKFLAAKPVKADLEFITELAAQGKIKPVIDSRYSLDKAAEAMQYISRGHSKGKVVITLQQ